MYKLSTALFNEKVDPDFQALWFRDIIEKIYINQQHRLLNNTELNILGTAYETWKTANFPVSAQARRAY